MILRHRSFGQFVRNFINRNQSTRNLINRNQPTRNPFRVSIKHLYSSNSASSSNDNHSKTVTVTYICPDGSERRVSGPLGQDLMRLAHANDIDLEGACEGSLACSTCHLIIQDPAMYRRTGEPSDEENDMLDLAFGLTETSRLGCQVRLAADLEGMVVRIPSATRNLAVDGFKPKPH